MTDFFDYIPSIAIVLFAIGIIGAIVYERVRAKKIEEPSP